MSFRNDKVEVINVCIDTEAIKTGCSASRLKLAAGETARKLVVFTELQDASPASCGQVPYSRMSEEIPKPYLVRTAARPTPMRCCRGLRWRQRSA